MNLYKSLALAAVVTLGGLGSAQAANETNFSNPAFLPPIFSTEDNTITFDFGSSLIGGATKAGDTFQDFYIFNTPDLRYVSFTALDDFSHGLGIAFDGNFHVAPYGFGTSSDFSTGFNLGAFEVGGGVALDSGTYLFEIDGTYLKNGAGYNGVILTTPVPEPANWALMLGGLCVVGTVLRRRQRG